MKLTREGKKERSKVFAKDLEASNHFFFTEYQGLKFHDLAALRERLRPVKMRFRVMKNSVARHAAQEARLGEGPDKLFEGPVAVVYGEGPDPVGSSKVLAAFAKEFPQLKFKAGFVDRRWMSSGDCLRLSKMGARVELLAQLAGVLAQPIAQVASVLQAPMRDLVLTLGALEKKRQAQPA